MIYVFYNICYVVTPTVVLMVLINTCSVTSDRLIWKTQRYTDVQLQGVAFFADPMYVRVWLGVGALNW